MEFINKLNFILENDNSIITKNGYEVVKKRRIEVIGQELKTIYEEVYNEHRKDKK